MNRHRNYPELDAGRILCADFFGIDDKRYHNGLSAIGWRLELLVVSRGRRIKMSMTTRSCEMLDRENAAVSRYGGFRKAEEEFSQSKVLVRSQKTSRL